MIKTFEEFCNDNYQDVDEGFFKKGHCCCSHCRFIII